MKFTKLLALFLTLYIGTANAILEVTVLKRIENAFPIVIAPFDVAGDVKKGKVIADIMRDNFNRSGEFSASSAENVISKVDFDHWQEKKAEAIVFGKIEKVSKKCLMFGFIWLMSIQSKNFTLKKLPFMTVASDELHIIYPIEFILHYWVKKVLFIHV